MVGELSCIYVVSAWMMVSALEVQNSKNGLVLDIHEGKQANLWLFYDVYVFDLKSIETIWGGDMDLISVWYILIEGTVIERAY